MTFRDNETKDFPVGSTDKSVWYGIIIHDVTSPRHSFTSSKSGKRELLDKIKQLQSDGQKFLVIGIWQGQWRTDIFTLDPKELAVVMREKAGI